MKLFDIGEISKREITPEGYLKVSAKVAKIGLQEYMPYVFADTDAPNAIKTKSETVKLLRPESEVSDKEALATIESVPVTDGHPSDFLDASNVTQFQKGFSKPGVKYENGFVFADLIIQDSALIKRVQAGKDQISLGYKLKVNWDAGVDPHYGAFDGTQTQIRVNHIAIVDAGRAGPEVRLDDETKGANKMAEKKANKTVENTELVDGLKDEIAVLKDKLDVAEKAADKLRGELDAANTKITDELNDAAVDERVNARIELVDRARKLHAELDANGKSDVEIKKESILRVNDSFDLTDKSDEYIDGVFESLAMNVKDSDTIVKDLKVSSGEAKPDARAKFIARSKDAYKAKGAK